MLAALSSPRQRLVLVGLLTLAFILGVPTARADGPRVSPNTGNLITTFCLFADGFNPYESVAMWLEFSNGAVYPATPAATVLANRFGNLGAQEGDLYAGNGCFFDFGDGTWVNGETRVFARGLASHHEVHASFTYMGQAAAPDGAGLHLSEQVYSPKDTPWWYFTGSGFNPNSRVSLWYSMPDGTIKVSPYSGEAFSDAYGVIHATMYRGELVTPGDYLVVASDGTHEYSTKFTFIISDANSISLPHGKGMTVNPAAGPIETFFLVFGGGFQPYETVDLWFTVPDGTITSFAISADERGIAELPYQAFPGEPLGDRVIHMYGRTSKFQLDGKFTILDAPYDP